MENDEEIKQKEVVKIELPAPPGWIKKLTPKEGGTTPRRNDIVFTAPTGEDIKTKRQLDQYLKFHPGGPSAVDFDWGTGDTPRHSTRLSEKSKMQEVPEIVTPKKKQKRNSEKKEAKENEDADGVEGSDDKDATKEETKGGPDISMADAENAGDDDGGEFTADGALRNEHNIEDKEEEQPAADVPIDSTTDKVAAEVEESKDATADVAGAKVEEFKDATSDMAGAKVEWIGIMMPRLRNQRARAMLKKSFLTGRLIVQKQLQQIMTSQRIIKKKRRKPRMTILEQGKGGNNKISSS